MVENEGYCGISSLLACSEDHEAEVGEQVRPDTSRRDSRNSNGDSTNRLKGDGDRAIDIPDF
jgi:hypothetical protein